MIALIAFPSYIILLNMIVPISLYVSMRQSPPGLESRTHVCVVDGLNILTQHRL